MPQKKYTSEDFKAMKKALKLTNKDIALIIGTGEANVKIQTAPRKELATWAKSMLYVYDHFQPKSDF